MWKRYTVLDWDLFSALSALPAFRPESVDASGGPEGDIHGADLTSFEDLASIGSVKHLRLNKINPASRLGEIRLPPTLETLRIDAFWIEAHDKPEGMARFVEELRMLPTRPILTFKEGLTLFLRENMFGDPLRMRQCLKVLRASGVAELRLGKMEQSVITDAEAKEIGWNGEEDNGDEADVVDVEVELTVEGDQEGHDRDE